MRGAGIGFLRLHSWQQWIQHSTHHCIRCPPCAAGKHGSDEVARIRVLRITKPVLWLRATNFHLAKGAVWLPCTCLDQLVFPSGNFSLRWGERASRERLAVYADVGQALARMGFPRRLPGGWGEPKTKFKVVKGIGVSQLLVDRGPGGWLVRFGGMALSELGECKARRLIDFYNIFESAESTTEFR